MGQEFAPENQKPAVPSWLVERAPLLLFPLLLVEPFLNFTRVVDYPFYAPVPVVICLSLIGVGLILALLCRRGGGKTENLVLILLAAFFLDVEFEIFRPRGSGILLLVGLGVILVFGIAQKVWAILTCIVATMTAATLGLAIFEEFSPIKPGYAVVQEGDDDPSLPPVLHLVLDEHIGLAGLRGSEEGEAAHRRLESFYADRGFHVFEKAYSQYAKTAMTLGHMFNFRHDFHGKGLVEPSGVYGRYRMSEVAYLDELRRRGYHLNIFQNDYLDLCHSQPPSAVTCDTTLATSLAAVRQSDLSFADKAYTVWNLFLDNSQLILRARAAYWRLQNVARDVGLTLPFWRPEIFHTVSASAITTLEKLETALKSAGPGQYYYAHLLLPHHPYIMEADCRLTPPQTWVHLGTRFIEGRLGVHDPSKWQGVAPSLFYKQLDCTYLWIDRLIASLQESGAWDEAVIVLHGDHGSRIGVRPPSTENFDRLSAREVLLNYSTLFAVRAPGLTAGNKDGAVPINLLFDQLVRSEFASVTAATAPLIPEVYALEEDDLLNPVARRYQTPLFPDPSPPSKPGEVHAGN